MPSSCFDGRPVDIDPFAHGSERRVEGPTEVGQLVKGGGLDAARVKMPFDQAVALGSAQRVGKHFVGDAIECVVQALVAAPTGSKNSKHGQRPPSR